MATKLPKPNLKNLWSNHMNKHLKIAFAISAVSVVLYKWTEDRNYHNKIEKFYQTYDLQKDFERKMKAGVFQCVDSNGVIRKYE